MAPRVLEGRSDEELSSKLLAARSPVPLPRSCVWPATRASLGFSLVVVVPAPRRAPSSPRSWARRAAAPGGGGRRRARRRPRLVGNTTTGAPARGGWWWSPAAGRRGRRRPGRGRAADAGWSASAAGVRSVGVVVPMVGGGCSVGGGRRLLGLRGRRGRRRRAALLDDGGGRGRSSGGTSVSSWARGHAGQRPEGPRGCTRSPLRARHDAVPAHCHPSSPSGGPPRTRRSVPCRGRRRHGPWCGPNGPVQPRSLRWRRGPLRRGPGRRRRRRALLRHRRRSPASPGAARGKGWSYHRPDGTRRRRRGRAGADRRHRHPAGVDRRVDQPRRRRPHPGHRPRRQGPQAVPLPPPVAGGAGRDKYDRLSDFGAALPDIRERLDEDLARRGLPAEQGARRRRAPARRDADPRRQRRVRRAERVVRPHHAAGRPRHRRGLDGAASSSRPSAASSRRSTSGTGAWPGSCRRARTCPARSCSSTSTTTARSST